MQTMTAKSNRASHSRACFHPATACRLGVKLAETSLRVRLSKCDFPYQTQPSIRLIGERRTRFKIGCERIISHLSPRSNTHLNHRLDEVDVCCKRVYGESAGARTQDQRLKRAMLYQLSYALEPHSKGSILTPHARRAEPAPRSSKARRAGKRSIEK